MYADLFIQRFSTSLLRDFHTYTPHYESLASPSIHCPLWNHPTTRESPVTSFSNPIIDPIICRTRYGSGYPLRLSFGTTHHQTTSSHFLIIIASCVQNAEEKSDLFPQCEYSDQLQHSFSHYITSGSLYSVQRLPWILRLHGC